MKNSIRSRLVRIQLTVAGVVLCLSTFAFLAQDIWGFRKALVDNLESTARIIGRNLEPTLSFQDPPEATRILRGLEAEGNFRGAVVFDRYGRLFAAHGDSDTKAYPELPKSPTVKFEGARVSYFYPLISEGDALGTLVIQAGTERLKAQARNYFLLAALVLVAGFAIAYSLAQYTQRALSSPIGALVAFMKQVSGTGNYSLRPAAAAKEAPEEIAILSKEFEALLGQVESRDRTITEVNHDLERKVEERTAQLTQASKMSALGEMAGGIAHEINNPLATLRIIAEQIQSLCEDDTLDKQLLTERATTLVTTITRISTIISNMLSFSRNSNKAPFESVNLKAWVDSTLMFCKERFKHHGVQVEVKLANEQLSVPARGGQLSQVLLNLLNNAFDAIAEHAEKWVSIHVEEFSDAVEIRVSNSGPKIPEPVAKELFKPFFTTKATGKGTGLGLSISQRIVEEHRGSLRLNFDSPHTEFIIRVPKQAATAQAA